MTAYTWELGIDWNAVETAGVSYLRGGLLQGSSPSSGTNPVRKDDNIFFWIQKQNNFAKKHAVEELERKNRAVAAPVPETDW